MVSNDYNFRFRVLYPLTVFLLNAILLILGIYGLNHYFNLIKLNFFSLIVISLFLLEAVIRFAAGQKLALPKVLFVLEAGLFLLILSIFVPGPYNIRLWLVWALGLISWFNIYRLTSSFSLFETNCAKVYGKNNGEDKGNTRDKWTFDEFRRLLDYPSHWKKIVEFIYFSNIPLVLVWALVQEIKVVLVAGSIVYLALEIFLLGSLYLEKKTLDWYIEGLERPPYLKKVWSVLIILTLIITMSTAALLPYNYNPLPLESISRWFSSRSLNFSPEGLPVREEPFVEQYTPAIPEEEGNGGGGFAAIIFFIIQLVLAASILLVIAALVFFFLKQEYSKGGNLPMFIRNFLKFIYNLAKGLFSRVREFSFPLKTFREILSREESRKKGSRQELEEIKKTSLPVDLRSLIITIYHSMLRLLALKGRSKKKTETPYEFSQMMGKRFENNRMEIKGITDLYVELIYSNHRIHKEVKNRIRELWGKLHNNC